MEILDSFGLNLRLFLFQFANFIIVAVILWFLILKPLTKKLSERQHIIEDSLDNAKQVEANLAKSQEDYRLQLRLARAEAEKILESAGNEAGQLSEELKAKAKQEIEALVKQAKHNIQREKEEMMLGFKEEAASLVALALEKLINEKMTAEKDKKLINEIVSKLR